MMRPKMSMEPMEIQDPATIDEHNKNDIETIEKERLLTVDGSNDFATSFKYTKAVSPPQKCSPCGLARICGTFMVVVVVGLVGLTYYPMMVLYGNGTALGTAILVVFNILVALLLVSYFQVMLTDPGTVPVEWAERARVTKSTRYPVCKKCNIHKPPRAHFDSITQRLVLNMDHYCPWTNNCIGFFNRKFFILFVSYTALASVYSVAFLGPYAWNTLQASKMRSVREKVALKHDDAVVNVLCLVAAIFDAMFAFVLILFAITHIVMAAWNQTSIEGSRMSKPFNLGVERNLELVFGRDKWSWFLPIYHKGPDGDGVHWECSDGRWLGYWDEEDSVQY